MHAGCVILSDVTWMGPILRFLNVVFGPVPRVDLCLRMDYGVIL